MEWIMGFIKGKPIFPANNKGDNKDVQLLTNQQ